MIHVLVGAGKSIKSAVEAEREELEGTVPLVFFVLDKEPVPTTHHRQIHNLLQ